MDLIVCEVCLWEYSVNSKIIPKILECGHTLCSGCVERILKCRKLCPTCRHPMTKPLLDNYPTNYIIISIIDKVNKHATLIKKLKKARNSFVETEKNLKKYQNQIQSDLNFINEGIVYLREEIDSEDRNFDHTEILLCGLKENLLKINLTQNSLLVTMCPNLDNPATFFTEIYNCISSGKECYAVTMIEQERRFARITIWSHYLAVHAFGPHVNNTNIQTVLYKDIKKYIHLYWTTAFLSFPLASSGTNQMITIRPTDISLVPRFLSFCTGENGHCFKESKYEKRVNVTRVRNQNPVSNKPTFVTGNFRSEGDIANNCVNKRAGFKTRGMTNSVIKIAKIVDNYESNEDIVFAQPSKNKTSGDGAAKAICTSCPEGSFNLYTDVTTPRENVVGFVDYFDVDFVQDIKSDQTSTIQDSGLIIDLKSSTK